MPAEEAVEAAGSETMSTVEGKPIRGRFTQMLEEEREAFSQPVRPPHVSFEIYDPDLLTKKTDLCLPLEETKVEPSMKYPYRKSLSLMYLTM